MQRVTADEIGIAAGTGLGLDVALHFAQIYCMSFQVLEREWLSMRASYMDFPNVMKRVQHSLEQALSNEPTSMRQLQHLLSLP